MTINVNIIVVSFTVKKYSELNMITRKYHRFVIIIISLKKAGLLWNTQPMEISKVLLKKNYFQFPSLLFSYTRGNRNFEGRRRDNTQTTEHEK